MTLSIDDYYELYSSGIKSEINEQNNLLKSYKKTKTYLVDQLKAFQSIIEKYCDLDFKDFKNATQKSIVKEFDKCFFPLKKNNINHNEAVRITRSLLATNKLIYRAELRLETLRKNLIPINVFKEFLKCFNKELLHSILYKGYIYDFGCGIDVIQLKRKKRFFGLENSHKVIDWGASNKLKAELIAKGETPLRYEKDENHKIIGSNNGKEWIVYYTDDYHHWLYWKKRQCNHPNRILYSFTPSGLILKDIQATKTNLEALANIKS